MPSAGTGGSWERLVCSCCSSGDPERRSMMSLQQDSRVERRRVSSRQAYNGKERDPLLKERIGVKEGKIQERK